MSKSWTVIDGHGERHIEEISDGVKLWLRTRDCILELGQAMSDSERRVRTLKKQLEIAPSLSAYNEMVKNLSPEDRETILMHGLLSLVMDKTVKTEYGVEFGQGKKAQLTILEDGVKIRRRYGNVGYSSKNFSWKIPKDMSVGTQISGIIGRFGTAPTDGGMLMLKYPFSVSMLTGLVNPETGEPRVNLDVLAKEY